MILAVVGLVAYLGWLLSMPVARSMRTSANRTLSEQRLRQIGLAILQYESDYGVFPPAYTADPSGRRLHSWRTLILPYLSRDDVYPSIDLDQPWNGPANRAAGGRPVDEFTSPMGTNALATTCNYLAVVGPGCVFQGATPVSIDQITDGTLNTAMVVEVHDPGVPWSEPRDLAPWELTVLVGPARGGVHVLFADGSVRFLSLEEVTGREFSAYLTINGGEALSF
jgi:prepilin-type processing-associated H-X9-DG protein